MMISFGVWSSGTFAYQLIFGNMGTKELAVMSLLIPIEGVFLSLFFGMASSSSIMVGQRLGANAFAEAIACARSFSVINPVIAAVLGFVVLLMRDVIFLPFQDLPGDTLQLAKNVFALITLLSWVKVINMTLAMGILRAGGDNNIVMYIDALGMWLISMPLTIAAAFYFGLPLFWVVLVAYSEEITKLLVFTCVFDKKYGCVTSVN